MILIISKYWYALNFMLSANYFSEAGRKDDRRDVRAFSFCCVLLTRVVTQVDLEVVLGTAGCPRV